MNIHFDISPDPKELGKRAAEKIAALLNAAIEQKGSARIILSTGQSQFETLSYLVEECVDWGRVEMFHLDEYIGLPESHPASFRHYLKERFVSHVPLKAAYFVDGEESIPYLTDALRKEKVDVGVIGIGENGHIAFNDPPADFDTSEAYKVVALDERCRRQQLGEGWIMKCEHIVSAVPHSVKAEALYNTITGPVSPYVPATILKTHRDWYLFADSDSASRLLPL